MLSKEETLKIADTLAAEKFLCSECFLMALARYQGVESSLIPRIATGFGAGIARSGEICGALSGAVMDLSFRYGRDKIEPIKDKRPYWYSVELLKRFKKEHGQLRCPALLGLDLDNPSEPEEFNLRNLWEHYCTRYILTATKITRNIIDENGYVNLVALSPNRKDSNLAKERSIG
jgi:C_GCAxxG_C_C family probable redox protein